MTKSEFLLALRKALYPLPEEEIQKTLAYYSEIIQDAMEEGMTEQEAVASLESVEVIAEKILYDTPLNVLIKERARKSGRVVSTVLIIAGSPLWVPILLALLAVLLAGFVALWAVVLALGAVTVALVFVGIALFIYSVPAFGLWGIAGTLAMVGAALCILGIGICSVYIVYFAAKGVIKLLTLLVRKVKSAFFKKGGETV
ncbi:DUF1700 domain-containing protein [Clostridia bacterium OttesenSCG-928-F22]|nr:DUF1700 domain-containing protein [Clostridia bacterium OttesenSCG-928-F22]